MICGSVGTGRRARLRILCSLRTCGFKSHLPHFLGIKRVYQKAPKPSKINGFGAFSCLNLSHKNPSFLPHSAPFLPHRFFIISLLNIKLDGLEALRTVIFSGQVAADTDYGFSATTSIYTTGSAEEFKKNHWNIHMQLRIEDVSNIGSNANGEVFSLKALTKKMGVTNITWFEKSTRVCIVANESLVSNVTQKIGRSGLLCRKYSETVFCFSRVYNADGATGLWGWDSNLYVNGVVFSVDILRAFQVLCKR